MAKVHSWLEKGNKAASRMPQLMCILMRQAQFGMPITYAAVGKELGCHHRAVQSIAYYIGSTLNEVGKIGGWKKTPPPPLQALIVNEKTGLPGSGFDGFMSIAYSNTKSMDKKKSILKAVYSELKNYPYWADLFDLLKIKLERKSFLPKEDLDPKKFLGSGGEGAKHLALKLFVANHPEIVGLAPNSSKGIVEYNIASGDKIDIVFNRPGRRVAIEVKPSTSSDQDVIRGVFQALKYRTVLQAQSALGNENLDICAILVLGRQAPDRMWVVAHTLGVEVVEGIIPT
ncbi:MAG: hypothetical protein ING71_00410 [Rhodocyclaceae bacterium]|nr:hypothetical protein [Rhodocyclaceae bacterium]